VPPRKEYAGDDAFHDAHSGYCCYLNTQTATTSFLQVKMAGRSLAGSLTAGPWAATPMGQSIVYTLRLNLAGSLVTCSLEDAAGGALATVSATNSAYRSGGLAFMALDGESSHHFLRFSAAAAPPTPSPTAPSLSPTPAFVTCSARTCNELGWPLELSKLVGYFHVASLGVCGASDASPLGGCSGDLSWAAARSFCQDVGARLCTLQEVVNEEPALSGCGYDIRRVWTQTPCESSELVKPYSTSCACSPRSCAKLSHVLRCHAHCSQATKALTSGRRTRRSRTWAQRCAQPRPAPTPLPRPHGAAPTRSRRARLRRP